MPVTTRSNLKRTLNVEDGSTLLNESKQKATKRARTDGHVAQTKKSKKQNRNLKASDPANSNRSSVNASTTSNTLRVIETTGSLFDAPANTLIVHACNTQGSWGGGIAKAFRTRYPEAYETYVDHCQNHTDGNHLRSTSLLIPPSTNASGKKGSAKHFIGCLFTSAGYGRGKDTPGRILAATGPAINDLFHRVHKWNTSEAETNGHRIEKVWTCRINSGLFRVPWGDTKTVMEDVDVSESDVKNITVVSPGNSSSE